MKLLNQISIVFIIFIGFSCVKKESPVISYKDLLIKKNWIRFNAPLLYSEQLKFNSDMSYRIQLISQFHDNGLLRATYNISGIWKIDKDSILFIQSVLEDYPKAIFDSAQLWQFGSPVTQFYGYKYNPEWRNDSIIIQFSDTAQEKIWEILELNNNTLTIKSNDQIVNYDGI
jgi:hypothetical protein